MRVCGKDFSSEMISRIQKIVDCEPGLSRNRLSRVVCKIMDWNDFNGQPKIMSCKVALSKLHQKGVLNLPISEFKGPVKSCRYMPEFTEREDLHCNFKDLGIIELVKVGSSHSKTSSLWKAFMNKYHYLKAGPLCGAQMRYMIKSEHYGWLGALAFSGAAWSVSCRDDWIGWSQEARTENLYKIVSNSRFLILPQVKVPNLASHVLSLCVKQIKSDWKERYGFEPLLLETFVEQGRFAGTCYKAANWQHIGSTTGRGRQDRNHEKTFPIKDLYLYPLNKKFKKSLCETSIHTKETLKPSKIKVSKDWAEEEFGNAQLGDERLNKRLLQIGRSFYAHPQAHIPQACKTRADTKAAYRFFENKRTIMDKLLQPHYKSTQNRIRQEKIVLAVQDTTSFNYSTHPATENLGPIGTSKEGLVGMLMHDTMAFNLEGTPLGLIDVQCWVRDPDDFGKRHNRHKLPIEQKESYKWLKSYQKTAEFQKGCCDTMIVSVGDREADIYDLFSLASSSPDNPELLIRAERDRLLADGQEHLWEHLSQKPISGIQVIHVPRQKNRKARDAQLEVRFAEVKLKTPKRKPELGEVTVWAVLAEEKDAPENVVPLKWMLLTTVKVQTFDDATEKLSWYTLRWGIEVYHRTLKSGCKIEERQLGCVDSIQACLAVDLVVGWRIYHLAKLGREVPDVPCTVYFEEMQWKALVSFIWETPIIPANPPSLRKAMHMVASLGGFLGRKSDGEPGTQTLWLGLQRLDDITVTYKAFVPHLKTLPVSSKTDYG